MRFARTWRSVSGGLVAVATGLLLAAPPLLAAGCAAGEDAAGRTGAAEASPDAQRYELQGTVVEVHPEQGTLVVDHEAVEGFMDAMTMPFNVRKDWVFDSAEPGAELRATLVVDRDRSWLEDVVIHKAAAESPPAVFLVPQPEPGDPVPVIAMVDQDSRALDLDAYRGRFWAFTFVYTRCPMPDFCPRVSHNFAQAYRAIEAQPDRYGDALLLSLTVDPAHDVPQVLREYGLEQLGDAGSAGFRRWRFARAEPGPLAELAGFAGIRFMPDQGEIVHSLRTMVVDPEGKVVKAIIGNTWETADLLQALEDAVAARTDGGVAEP